MHKLDDDALDVLATYADLLRKLKPICERRKRVDRYNVMAVGRLDREFFSVSGEIYNLSREVKFILADVPGFDLGIIDRVSSDEPADIQMALDAAEELLPPSPEPDGVFHRVIRVNGNECDLSELQEKICRAFAFNGTHSIDVGELSRKAWGEIYQHGNDRKIAKALSDLGTKLSAANIGWRFTRRGEVVTKEHV